MASQLAQNNFRVLVAAGDTFRAAAGGQLKVWTERAQSEKGHVEIFWPDRVTDPAAVAYDSVQKAVSQKYDYVLLDTAGRLHTQIGLMDELKKVKRVMSKVIPEAPHETWIVLDGNAGQNAVMQAEQFQKSRGNHRRDHDQNGWHGQGWSCAFCGADPAKTNYADWCGRKN